MFGFDFRYHALSLIAVLIALAVGLLLGVAIGDKGLVSSAETNLRQSLRGEVHQQQQKVSTLQGQLKDATDIERKLYSVGVGGQLAAKRIGIIGLGSLPNSIVQDTIDALQGSGGNLRSKTVIGLPLDLSALATKAAGTRYEALSVDPTLIKRFGTRIGVQLVGGSGNLLKLVQNSLLTSGSNGQLDGMDAVVLYRSDPGKLSDADAANAKAFEDGLIAGLTAHGVSVVAVQRTDTDPSQISWFKNHNTVSSVDDIDEITGKISLVYALGGLHGNYGARSGGPPVPQTGLAITTASPPTTTNTP